MIVDSSAILAILFRESGAEALLSTIMEADFAGIGSPTRFGKGRHPAALNFGDCMTYATAALAGQPLLCRGDDFPKTDLELV